MKKACIVIPYYGQWPPYLNLFLESCSYNPELTILFFTDLQPPSLRPANVKFHSFTLSQIKSALDEILNFKSALNTPYKLCDIRPAYGLIFKSYLKEFDYWGWGDIDLVFGKLSDLKINELLGHYDTISFRKKWLSGSFCLIRNTDQLNRLFLTNSDLVKVFSTSDYKGFDEISLCWEQIRKMAVDKIRWPWSNFTLTILNRTDLKSYFNDMIKESIRKNDFLIWNQGRLTDSAGTAYTHYHFITEKRQPYFNYPKWKTVPPIFYITRAGFFTETQFRKRNVITFKRWIAAFPRIMLNFLNRAKRYATSQFAQF